MDDRDEDAVTVACRVYTHARRHPLIIGNIQGLRIPPVTPAQLGIGVGVLLVLALTRGVWAHLGALPNGLALVGLPVAAAWSVRAVRPEGRAPWRAGLGWLTLALAPRGGRRLGRVDRTDHATRRYRPATWISETVQMGGR